MAFHDFMSGPAGHWLTELRRRLDREYWEPLKRELEVMRFGRRREQDRQF